MASDILLDIGVSPSSVEQIKSQIMSTVESIKPKIKLEILDKDTGNIKKIPQDAYKEFSRLNSIIESTSKTIGSLGSAKSTQHLTAKLGIEDQMKNLLALKDLLVSSNGFGSMLSKNDFNLWLDEIVAKISEFRTQLSSIDGGKTFKTITEGSVQYYNILNQAQTMLSTLSSMKEKLATGDLIADEKTVSGINEMEAALKNLVENAAGTPLEEARERLAKFGYELKNLQANTKENNVLSEGSTQYYQYIKQIESMSNAVKNLQDKIGTGKGVANKQTVNDLAALSQELQQFSTQLNGMPTEDAASKIAQLQARLTSLTGQVRSSGSIFNSFFSGMGAGIQQYIAMTLSWTRIIMTTVQEIKQMISTAVELDSAFTQLQIVTGASDSTMANFASTIATTAKDMSASVKDLTEVATVYSRLGYSLDESNVLAKYTAMIQNVGDIDPSAASDSVTAIVKAYGKGVDDIESIMDKMVVVGNNFPISVSQIAEGMNNAASMMANAGMDFDQSVALLTAANTTVQNISKSSTALRTIIARLRNVKSELDDAGEVWNEAKYQELISALTDGGVQLQEATGALRNPYEVLSELAAKWSTMSSDVRAAITTALAGTRQQDVFASLMNQFGEATGAMEAMQNSAGALNDAYGIFEESMQGHINKLKAAFEELSMTAVDSGFMNSLVDLGTSLLEVFTPVVGVLGQVVSALGPLGTALTTIGAIGIGKSISNLPATLSQIGAMVNALNVTNSAIQFNNVPAALDMVKTSLAGVNAQTIIASSSMLGLDASQLAVMLSASGMSAQEVAAALATQGYSESAAIAAMNTANFSVQEVAAAVNTTAFAAAEEGATVATLGLSSALKGLGVFLTTNPFGWAIMAGAAIAAIAVSVDLLTESFDEAVDKADKSKQAWQNSQSEIASLNGELDTTQSRIDELNAKGGLTLVEQEELSNLEHQNELLETQIAARERLAAIQEGTAVKDAANVLTKDSFQIEKSTSADGMSTAYEAVNIIEYTTKMQEELNEKTAEYEDIQERLASLNENDPEYKALQNRSDFLNKQISSYADTISSNLDIINDQYDTIVESGGTAHDALIKQVDDLFNYIAHGSDESYKTKDLVDRFFARPTIQKSLDEAKKIAEESVSGIDVSTVMEMFPSVGAAAISAGMKVEEFAQMVADSINSMVGAINVDEVKQQLTDAFMLANNPTGVSDSIATQMKEQMRTDWVDYLDGLSDYEIKLMYGIYLSEDTSAYSFEDWQQALETAKTATDEMIADTVETIENSTYGYDELATAIAKVTHVQDIMNKVAGDGDTVTKSAYESLVDFIGSEEAVAGCIDTTNGYLVTNSKGLKDLVAATNKSIASNVQLGVSQNRLKFHELVNTLGAVVNSTETYDAATMAVISTIESELDATQLQIAQYKLLEQQLLGTTSAFEALAEAQQIDEARDYTDDLSSGIEALISAYENHEFGTETFKTAFDAFIPEDVYDQFVDAGDQLDAGWDYLNTKLSRYMDIDEGKVSIDFDNVASFVEDALSTAYGDSTVLTGTLEDFDLNPQITSIEQFADAMGVTTEVAFALGNAISKYTTDGEDFLSQLTSNGSNLETQLMAVDTEMAELLLRQAELGESGQVGTEEWDNVQAAIADCNAELDQLRADARENVHATIEIDSEIESKQAEVDELKATVDSLEENGATQAEIDVAVSNYETAKGELDTLIQEKYDLGSPTDITIEVALEQVAGEIEATKAQLDEIATYDGTTYTVKAGIEASQSDVDSLVTQLQGLEAEQHEIMVYAGVEDEATDPLNEIIDITIDDKTFSVIAYTSQAMSQLWSVINTMKAIQDKSVTVTTNYVSNGSPGGTSPAYGTARAFGTAHDGGVWGTRKAERNALVGELGEEIIVDPDTGVWRTVGTRGAEMVSLPKGAIVFNHRQTEALLRYRRINSRGSAVANGNAFVGGNAYFSDFGSKKYTWGSSSGSSGTGSSSGSGGYGSSSSSSYSAYASSVEETVNEAAGAFEDLYKYHQHLVTMEQETQAEYLAWLEGAYKSAYYNAEIELEDYYKYEEEVYTGLKDLRKTEFEDLVSYHEHMVSMDRETQEEYLNWLNVAFQDAYALGKITLEDFYKYEEEVYEGFKKLYQQSFIDDYDYHQHMVAMEQETDADYLSWLIKAYKEAYDSGKIGLEDYRKYQEEVFKGLRDLFKDYLGDVEHEVSMHEHFKNDVGQIVSLYSVAMKDIEDRISRSRKDGLDDNDEYIQTLQDDWWKYHDYIENLEEKYTNEAKSNTSELVNFRIKMLKQQIEDQKDALDKELDDLKDFYDKQKQMLKDARDDEKYLKEQTEKRKAVTDIELELNRLAYDDSAWAQKRKLELQEDLVEAREKLADFEKDHALEATQDELDAMYEKQEQSYNDQIDLLDNKLEDARGLYKQALNDVRNGSVALYEEMIEYNARYGSGIDSDITDMWNSAYGALDDYYKLYQKVYNGFNLANATGYSTEGTWVPQTNSRTVTPRTSSGGSGGSGNIMNATKSSLGNTNPKDNSSVMRKNITATMETQYTSAKYPYGKIYDFEGSLRFGDKGNSVKIVQNALKQLGYYDGEINGSFDWPTWYAVGAFQNDTLNYDWATDEYGVVGGDTKWQLWFRGYRAGTQNATRGLHRIDEDGDEYIFTSGNGNRYRMFSGGEKVLTAKQTDFLYQFAKSGGTVLENIIKAATGGNISDVTNSKMIGDIRMGDIIINGNADQKTVSQIRREQREGVNYLLTQFAHLQQ